LVAGHFLLLVRTQSITVRPLFLRRRRTVEGTAGRTGCRLFPAASFGISIAQRFCRRPGVSWRGRGRLGEMQWSVFRPEPVRCWIRRSWPNPKLFRELRSMPFGGLLTLLHKRVLPECHICFSLTRSSGRHNG